MSIKGNSQELYVGKEEINIFNSLGKRKTITYDEMAKIEYCFREFAEGGYMDFHDNYGGFYRFLFPKKKNQAIQRAVDYISERYPDLEIIRHDTSDDPFYTKIIFIALMSLFCCFPLGLILMWCTGKRSLSQKISFTIGILIFHFSCYFASLWYYQMQMNNALNELNNLFNQIGF